MLRYILPTILIGSAIAGFLIFTEPFYKDVLLKREQITAYNEALDNSKALEAERDKLTQKYNSIDPDNLAKLQKFLPDSVDNIRLILEIGKLATPYGMVLKDVKYDVGDEKEKSDSSSSVKKSDSNTNKKYGVWNLEFSTQGTYSNFMNFVKNIENNLRIVDIYSVGFSSNTANNNSTGINPNLPQIYKYDFKIKTYWLKN